MAPKFVLIALFSLISVTSFHGRAFAEDSEINLDSLLLEIENSGAPEFVPGSLSEDEVRAESGLPSLAECANNPLLEGCFFITPVSDTIVRVEVALGLQQLSVYVNDSYVETYLISSGTLDRGTPRGSFRVTEANATKVSTKYDNAPMPLALKFTEKYHALHCGNIKAKNASHGCVRVERPGCEALWALQKEYHYSSFVVNISHENPNVVAIEGDNRPFYGEKTKATANKSNKSKTATKKAVAQKSTKKTKVAAASFEEEVVVDKKPTSKLKKVSKKVSKKVKSVVGGIFESISPNQ